MRIFIFLFLTLSGLLWLESDTVFEDDWPQVQGILTSVESVASFIGWTESRTRMSQSFRDWVDGFAQTANEVDQSDSLQAEDEAVQAVSVENPLKVLILGDSLASYYLPTALSALAARDGRVRVESFSRVSASLSNPIRLNFLVEVPRFFGNRRGNSQRAFDVVVVMMGANDAQAIRGGTQVIRYGTQAWTQEFRRRTRDLMNILTQEARGVYWLELPPMRDRQLESGIQNVQNIFQDVVREFPGSRFLELRRLLSDSSGNYTAVGFVEGRQVILRARDGIHISTEAGRILAREIWRNISLDFLPD